jgi:DNA-binding transcriptional ArsR family regulator
MSGAVQQTETARKSDDPDELRARLLAALLHPLRRSILGALSVRTASAREIAAETGCSPESIGHQLRRLRREGLIQLEASRRRRGVAENYYRATLEPIIDDDDFEALSLEQRRQFSVELIKSLYVDINRALKEGTFDSRSDSCAGHIRLTLDESGWRELAEIHRETLEEVIVLRRRAAARIRQTGSVGTPTVSAVLCFEMPGPVDSSAGKDY